MESSIQKAKKVLLRNNTKEIQNEIQYVYEKTQYNLPTHSGEFVDYSEIGDTLIELVSRVSTDFTKDIATRCIKTENNPTHKQSWCLAFQITKNSEDYLKEWEIYNKECEKAYNECIAEINN